MQGWPGAMCIQSVVFYSLSRLPHLAALPALSALPPPRRACFAVLAAELAPSLLAARWLLKLPLFDASFLTWRGLGYYSGVSSARLALTAITL